MKIIQPKKAIILIGLQASGKSSFYHEKWEGFDRLYFVRMEQNRFVVEDWKETL